MGTFEFVKNAHVIVGFIISLIMVLSVPTTVLLWLTRQLKAIEVEAREGRQELHERIDLHEKNHTALAHCSEQWKRCEKKFDNIEEILQGASKDAGKPDGGGVVGSLRLLTAKVTDLIAEVRKSNGKSK